MTDRASNNAFEVLREQLRRQMNELSDHIMVVLVRISQNTDIVAVL